MKSFFKHINKVVLCLSFLILMVGVFIIAPVNAAEELDAKIKVSYEFQDDFDMIFNCKIYTKGEFDSVHLLVEFEGKTTTLTVPDSYDKESGFVRYIFRDVSAAEMTSVAKATLVASKGNVEYRSETIKSNLKDYSMNLLNHYEKVIDEPVDPEDPESIAVHDYSEKICTALVDMLNYGAASQTFFNKNTSNLANKNLTSSQKALGSTLSDYNSPSSCYSKNELSNATATIQKIALSFENPVDLVVYSSFNSDLSSDVSAVLSYKDAGGAAKTLTVFSSEFEKQESDNLYRVEFKDIPSDCFKTPLSIVYKKENKAISSTVTYSCESYANAILKDNSQDAKVKDLVKKMLAYGDSAKAYSATLPTDCVTYRQFGAMGTGVKEVAEGQDKGIDDYYAILMTHDYANMKSLPVKADKGAHYYVKFMDPRSYQGALIKTETDWGNGKFTIDDEKLGNATAPRPSDNQQIIGDTIHEGDCFLFTIEPSKPFEFKYSNDARKIYLGLDANLDDYPNYPDESNDKARNLINKTFSKTKTTFDGNFKESALYVLTTSSFKRWARNDKGYTKGIDQEEIIIINPSDDHKHGIRDSSTPLCWDWKEMYKIIKYPIDTETLTVKGGDFTTLVNTDKSTRYIYRGISVVRSNVVLEGVKHNLAGEEKMFTTSSKNKAKQGAPYHGFIRLDHCAHVTVRNCTFTDHLRGFFKFDEKGNYIDTDNQNSTAPYDFYAELAADITLEGCSVNPTKVEKYNLSDPTGYMDMTTRWGTMGTNYLKDLKVIDCKLSRVDAHRGVYNLTVQGCDLGIHGIATVGFGKMLVENTTSQADHFISLRRDYGSAWFGDIEINNCFWDIGERYTSELIDITYDPTVTYCYDTVVENGRTYYSQMPKNITVNGFTIDASKLPLSNGHAFYSRGFNLFNQVIFQTGTVDENYLTTLPCSYEEYCNDKQRVDHYKYPYFFPIKAPEKITVTGVHIIRRDDAPYQNKNTTDIYMRNGSNPQINDAYFFDPAYNPITFTKGSITYSNK